MIGIVLAFLPVRVHVCVCVCLISNRDYKEIEEWELENDK